MKSTIFFGLLLIFLLGGAPSAWPAPQGELLVLKQDPFLYGPCEPCSDMVAFDEGENTVDFDQRNFATQTGYHYVYIKGPAGTTVTLFGGRQFGLDNGYLIIRKQDDRTIHVRVTDLEQLPANQWFDIGPGDGNDGNYSAWVQPNAYLESRIGSLKWGKWWSRLPVKESK